MSYIPLEHQPSVYRTSRKVTLAPEGGDRTFRYGVSLYSFMGDYGTVMDLETALAAVADVGATGVEILGEGHIPNYPEPSPAWMDTWFGLLEKYSLEPTNYGSWIDTRLHPGRTMTVAEGAAALQRDLRLASQLGFGFVRPKIGVVSGDLVPDPIWTESVERSLDLAHELGIIICPEIHSPTPIRHPVVEDYIGLIERTGTKNFGLLIDTGIFQDRPIPLREGETRQTGPPSSTASASIPPTSRTSRSTWCSSRRSSTTSTSSWKTSRFPGCPCSRPSRTPATPVISPANTKANARPGAPSSRCGASTP